MKPHNPNIDIVLVYGEADRKLIEAQRKVIAELEGKLAQVERERDAAVADIRKASSFLCRVCTKNDWPNCAAGRNNLYSDDVVECEDFEWLGVPENTKEE